VKALPHTTVVESASAQCDRCVCTPGSCAVGVADRHVHVAGVGAHRGGGDARRLFVERDCHLLGVDGWGLGGRGFLSGQALDRCGQGLLALRLWALAGLSNSLVCGTD